MGLLCKREKFSENFQNKTLLNCSFAERTVANAQFIWKWFQFSSIRTHTIRASSSQCVPRNRHTQYTNAELIRVLDWLTADTTRIHAKIRARQYAYGRTRVRQENVRTSHSVRRAHISHIRHHCVHSVCDVNVWNLENQTFTLFESPHNIFFLILFSDYSMDFPETV